MVYFTHILQGYFTGTGAVPVPVKQPWRIWVNNAHGYTTTYESKYICVQTLKPNNVILLGVSSLAVPEVVILTISVAASNEIFF